MHIIAHKLFCNHHLTLSVAAACLVLLLRDTTAHVPAILTCYLHQMMQGLFSNGMVLKMVLKHMQGKAGMGTKMVLPRKRTQVVYLLY